MSKTKNQKHVKMYFIFIFLFLLPHLFCHLQGQISDISNVAPDLDLNRSLRQLCRALQHPPAELARDAHGRVAFGIHAQTQENFIHVFDHFLRKRVYQNCTG